MDSTGKGRILFILNPEMGHITVHSRGLIFKDFLQDHGWTVRFVNVSPQNSSADVDAPRESEDQIVESAKGYDLVYLLRVNSLRFIKRLRNGTKAKIVFELSDALWKPNFRVGFFYLEEILELVDALFTENEFVSQYGKQYNPNVYNLTACTQTEKFDQSRREQPPRNDNRIVLGWIGSAGTVPAIFSIIKSLERLSARFPALHLRILGCDPQKLEKPLRNVRYSAVASYDEDAMIREAINMDIGLFPAPGNMEDYLIRGPLKALVYMSAGIPAVCLNSGDSAKIITDGANGVLIDSPDQWDSKLEKLILDPVLRKEMGMRAYETVRDRHSLESTGAELERAFLNVLHLPVKESASATTLQQLTRIFSKLNIGLMIFIEKAKRGLRTAKRFLALELLS